LKNTEQNTVWLKVCILYNRVNKSHYTILEQEYISGNQRGHLL